MQNSHMAKLEIVALADAMKQKRLQDFIAHEELRVIGPIDRFGLNAVTAALAKAPQSENQTSHSASGDDSSGWTFWRNFRSLYRTDFTHFSRR
jgi:hypothetical protein